jgi:2-haloacid dehalogenase
MLACFASVVGADRAEDVLARYHQHEAELETEGGFRPYREVLAEAFRRAAGELGRDLSPAEAARLPESVPHWPVFPEVAETLGALRASGYRLAVLSNIDDDIIDRTLPQLGAPIDLVITAEQVRSYKPAAGHFDAMQQRSGVETRRWVHVGCSYYHDIDPCTRRGVVGIMVNREAQPGPFDRATAVLDDLRRLPQVVADLRLVDEVD